MAKFKVGIMSSTWDVEASNIDVAIVRLLLETQTSAPVAVYSGEESQFSVKRDADELEEFILANKDAIREARTTKTA